MGMVLHKNFEPYQTDVTIVAILLINVHSENFTTVLFSQNFAEAKFRENKSLEKSLCPLLVLVNHALVAIFNVASLSFKAIRENKILAKNLGLTVS